MAGKEKKEKCSRTTVLVKMIVGIIFVVVGLVAVISWWQDFVQLVKGVVGLLLVLVGIITIAIAKE